MTPSQAKNLRRVAAVVATLILTGIVLSLYPGLALAVPILAALWMLWHERHREIKLFRRQLDKWHLRK